MIKNKSIWHTIEEKPNDFCDIVLVNSLTGSCSVFLSPCDNISFVYDKWAYLIDLVELANKLESSIFE